MEPIWTLGLMSGTSLDGIDAALLLTDGERIYDKADNLYVPYHSAFRNKLRSQLGCQFFDQDIEEESTWHHINVAQQLLNQTNKPVKLIGYHGQTTYHNPPITTQMGRGDLMSREIGLPVVYDFRSADCSTGGQGAPLVPIYHQALTQDMDVPIVIVNIGGVANLTYIDRNVLIAGDTGPGNALINDVMKRDFDQEFDLDGQLASSYPIDREILTSWFQDPFFSKPFPKSLDRDHFRKFTTDIHGVSGIANLTALTAGAILHGINLLPGKPKQILVCGGGAKNKMIMKLLGNKARVISDADFIEAQAFAFLAVRVLRGLPTSFPTTTGCHIPTCGGQISQPND